MTTDLKLSTAYQQPIDDPLFLSLLRTISYADIFDYPLKLEEIHRYLEKCQAPQIQIQEILSIAQVFPDLINMEEGFYTLPGRNEIIQKRKIRSQIAEELWPKAKKYGLLIWRLPFVRMVAVTGALAMDNEDKNDIDYLIITEHGRLWLCRALVILLVRLAGLQGDLVCPNYFLSENTLIFNHRDLYTAHEIAQMVPLYGFSTYLRIRELNPWVEDYLPNAVGLPRKDILLNLDEKSNHLAKISESILRSKVGGWIESWEMKRKIRKFSKVVHSSVEADFSADYCKGHFGEYGQQTMQAYTERTQVLYDAFNLGV